jgi:multisubunit Na+/H+ antiporter MnhE subunit
VMLGILYLCWMLFVGTFARDELLLGIAAVLLAGFGLRVVQLSYPARFSPTLREMMAGWRIPWYLLSGTYEITAVSLQDLLGYKRAKSLFRVARFKSDAKMGPEGAARSALAVTYTTVAPNFIVLGINAKEQQMLFHQIERSSVPRMTQELGAA